MPGALSGRRRRDLDPEERGRIFVLIVGAQLVRTGLELFYWREGKYEVDYVLKSGKNVFAVEVKSGKKKSARGIEEFLKKVPGSKAVIITPENYEEFEDAPLEFIKRIARV